MTHFLIVGIIVLVGIGCIQLAYAMFKLFLATIVYTYAALGWMKAICNSETQNEQTIALGVFANNSETYWDEVLSKDFLLLRLKKN